MGTDELTLSKALEAECRRLEADLPTIITAAARLVAAWCVALSMVTASSEEAAELAETTTEVFRRILAAHLAHAAAKFQQPPH